MEQEVWNDATRLLNSELKGQMRNCGVHHLVSMEISVPSDGIRGWCDMGKGCRNIIDLVLS